MKGNFSSINRKVLLIRPNEKEAVGVYENLVVFENWKAARPHDVQVSAEPWGPAFWAVTGLCLRLPTASCLGDLGGGAGAASHAHLFPPSSDGLLHPGRPGSATAGQGQGWHLKGRSIWNEVLLAGCTRQQASWLTAHFPHHCPMPGPRGPWSVCSRPWAASWGGQTSADARE